MRRRDEDCRTCRQHSSRAPCRGGATELALARAGRRRLGPTVRLAVAPLGGAALLGLRRALRPVRGRGRAGLLGRGLGSGRGGGTLAAGRRRVLRGGLDPLLDVGGAAGRGGDSGVARRRRRGGLALGRGRDRALRRAARTRPWSGSAPRAPTTLGWFGAAACSRLRLASFASQPRTARGGDPGPSARRHACVGSTGVGYRCSASGDCCSSSAGGSLCYGPGARRSARRRCRHRASWRRSRAAAWRAASRARRWRGEQRTGP